MRLLAALFAIHVALAGDWPGFRGHNASGVSTTTGLPVEFGPNKNVVWKTPIPPGHSSPVLTGDRIFVTASRAQLEEKLYGWKDEISSNAVEVYVHGLRTKLGADLIRNVRGVGYMVPRE